MRLRNGIAVLCMAFSISACSSSNSDYSAYLQLLRQGFGHPFSRSDVSLQQAGAVPYASMGWRMNGGSENLIVLATANGSRLIWTSAAHIVLQTQDGRIVRTVGLPEDLSGLTPQNSTALSPPGRALVGAYSESRSSDFPQQGQFGVTTVCNARSSGARSVTILGKKIRTLRVDEDCRRDDDHFVDTYWLDPRGGMVWRSIQHLRSNEVLETEILRPPE